MVIKLEEMDFIVMVGKVEIKWLQELQTIFSIR
jgi:hypothetical protein